MEAGMIDQSGRVVLVTGGTAGIGLAVAKAFARCGAQAVMTYRWGSADLEQVRREFRELGAPDPLIVEADVADEEQGTALMETIARHHGGVDVYIANVAFSLKAKGLEDWTKRALYRSLDYSAWPLWSYTKLIHDRFGRYPKHIIGLSSDGAEHFFMNYDFVAISKAVLETMCRYMQFRLREEGVRVNVVRSRLVQTASFDATFGPEFRALLDRLGGGDCFISPDDLANVVLCLGSGMMDTVAGQVIMADGGWSFFDNTMGIAELTGKGVATSTGEST
jgi:NAD(P)-dependent dehydrogenase (short-subunit alcohol dehydrogenase family)